MAVHNIKTACLPSDRPTLAEEMRRMFSPETFRIVVPLAGDRGGLHVLVLGNGAVLRDIVDWLDRAGWLD
jgi:hypothetical protein